MSLYLPEGKARRLTCPRGNFTVGGKKIENENDDDDEDDSGSVCNRLGDVLFYTFFD
jgi:hypothetical protein